MSSLENTAEARNTAGKFKNAPNFAVEVTEAQLRNILRSSMHSVEDLAIVALLDILNGEFTLEELRIEINNAPKNS